MGRPRRDAEFDAFVDRVFPRAWRLARRVLGDDVAAEEAAADGLARACAKWHQWRSSPELDGRVLREVAAVAVDATKGRAYARRAAMLPTLVDAVAHRLALVEALHHLPRRQSELVMLRYLSDLTPDEVAAALGLSEAAFESSTEKALTALRRHLGDEREVPLALQP
jgi:DNA-directed RNA polymerase specialized sigma24 family protein